MNEIKRLKELLKDIKVLYVEDEEKIRESVACFLKKFFGYVSVCSDGECGMERFFEEGGFDVVMTDLLMPKMDGLAMTKVIKDNSPNTFVVFLTASRELNDEHTKLSDMIAEKPIEYDDMIAIIRRLGVEL